MIILTYGAQEASSESIVSVSHYQAGLPYGGVPNDDDLHQSFSHSG